MVEWKELKEVFDTRNGYTPSTSNETFWEGGNIPWFKMEDLRDNGGILNDSYLHITEKAIKGKGLFKANSILLATSATIGEHALIEVEHLSNQRFTNFYPKKEYEQIINMRYAYYYMFIIDEWCKQHVNQGGFASVDMSGLYKHPFPIPSISEQERIVDILDTFTASIDNLKEQIVQRRKQYEYYRDQLLDLEGKEGVEMKTLNDLCKLITKQTGFDYTNTIKPSLTVKREADSIPFIQNKDFEGTIVNLNTDFFIPISVAQKFPKILLNDKILLVSISGRIGNVGLYEISDVSFVGGAICVCRLNKDTNGRYVLYFLQSQKGQGSLFHSVKAASHANITVEAIRKTIVPLPPLSEQQRIVDILDKFEASIQNLEAQLAQREKQYEYYRNKLLTFE